MDVSVPGSEWVVTVLPDNSPIQVTGEQAWSGALSEGEKKSFELELEFLEKGLYTVQVRGKIPVMAQGESFCCGLLESFFVLFDGEKTWLNKQQDQWCRQGEYLDEETLSCIEGSPPARQLPSREVTFEQECLPEGFTWAQWGNGKRMDTYATKNNPHPAFLDQVKNAFTDLGVPSDYFGENFDIVSASFNKVTSLFGGETIELNVKLALKTNGWIDSCFKQGGGFPCPQGPPLPREEPEYDDFCGKQCNPPCTSCPQDQNCPPPPADCGECVFSPENCQFFEVPCAQDAGDCDTCSASKSNLFFTVSFFSSPPVQEQPEPMPATGDYFSQNNADEPFKPTTLYTLSQGFSSLLMKWKGKQGGVERLSTSTTDRSIATMRNPFNYGLSRKETRYFASACLDEVQGYSGPSHGFTHEVKNLGDARFFFKLKDFRFFDAYYGDSNEETKERKVVQIDLQTGEPLGCAVLLPTDVDVGKQQDVSGGPSGVSQEVMAKYHALVEQRKGTGPGPQAT